MTDPYDTYLDDFGARLRSTSTAPAPATRRRGLIAGSVAAVGALALTLVLLPTGSPKGTPLDAVAEARAALSPRGEIVYLKIRTGPPGGGPLETTEQWTAAGPRRWRFVQTIPDDGFVEIIPADRRHGVVGHRRGRHVAGRVEFSYARGARSGYVASFDELTVQEGYAKDGAASRLPGPLGLDPATDLRALLAQGSVRDTGLAERDGRTVRRLVRRKPLPGGGVVTFVYDVDPDTFAPIAAELRVPTLGRRVPGGPSIPPRTTTTVLTVLAYKRIPLTPRSAKLLRIQTTPKTKVIRISAAERRRQQRVARKGCRTRANGTKVCPFRPPPRP